MVLHKMSMHSPGSCVSSCVTGKPMDSRMKTGYEYVGVMECIGEIIIHISPIYNL